MPKSFFIIKKAKERLSKTLLGDIFSKFPRESIKIMTKILFSPKLHLSFKKRLQLLNRFKDIRLNIDCAHSSEEYLIPAYEILAFPKDIKGSIVEAGCYGGGGTAKLSIAASLTNRNLFAFDSFEGMPANKEPIAKTSLGYNTRYYKGKWKGALEEVKSNIKKWGEISSCKFIKGHFKKTMPNFNEPIILVFCDVDLALSNKTCIKYLWPNLVKGGLFFSQDAHIPIVKELFNNENFWKKEVGLNYIPKFHHITKRLGYFIKK
ncbi:MAG TPA: TylF/MycF/NovP-related O-methyltransferase [Candidatus Nanoarchaeia archaeon]|nr:TylF/MycF/NovP-related O-methyltransferase [Candidatus Nanoarchaeia archaeon]